MKKRRCASFQEVLLNVVPAHHLPQSLYSYFSLNEHLSDGITNLLESIYVSGTSRSHRGSRDKELIRFGEDEAHIRLFFQKDSLSHRLDVHLKKNKNKGIAVDGVPVRRSGENSTLTESKFL